MIRPPPTPTLFPYTTLFRSMIGHDRWFGPNLMVGAAFGQSDGQGAHTLRGDRERNRQVATQRVDRKSTRLNSSHSQISYAVFCLKKKNTTHPFQFILVFIPI